MLVIYGTAYEQVPGSGRRTKFGSHSTKSAPTPSTIVPAVADTPTPELPDLASKNTGRPFTFELQINKEYFFSHAFAFYSFSYCIVKFEHVFMLEECVREGQVEIREETLRSMELNLHDRN